MPCNISALKYQKTTRPMSYILLSCVLAVSKVFPNAQTKRNLCVIHLPTTTASGVDSFSHTLTNEWEWMNQYYVCNNDQTDLVGYSA